MNAVVNRVTQQVQVNAPIEHAYEFVCQVDRQREWNPYLEYFHATRLDTVGTEFDVILDLLGQSTSFHGTVVEVAPRQLIHLHLVADRGAADWWYHVEPAEGGTQFRIDVEYEKEGLLAGVVDRFVYHSSLERAVGHMAENFAKLLPAKAPVPA